MLLDSIGLLYEPSLILAHEIYITPGMYVNNIVFLSYKLHTSFLDLPIFILSDKNGKSLCKPCKFFMIFNI